MEVQLYKLQVIKGKESLAREWLDFLETNKEAGKETLKNEKVYFESYFQEVVNEQMFVYLFIMCHDIKRANQVAMNSDNPLDKKHFEYMTSCIDLTQGNIMAPVLFLDNLSDKN